VTINLFSIPCVQNDYGIVALNHIIDKLNGMSTPNETHSYITHEFMKDTIMRTGGTWTHGNQYDLNDLLEVMLKMHIINYSPYITHPNGTSIVHLPSSTIGILVRPKSKAHFYCCIPSMVCV